MTDSLAKKKIQWQCRRGYLEIDLLLSRFMERHYDQKTPQEQQVFAQLLRCNDTDLLAWLTGMSAPQDASLKKMVDDIRGLP